VQVRSEQDDDNLVLLSQTKTRNARKRTLKVKFEEPPGTKLDSIKHSEKAKKLKPAIQYLKESSSKSPNSPTKVLSQDITKSSVGAHLT